MFTSNDSDKPRLVCEDCYRLHHYGDSSFEKRYKHSVLQESITPEISRNICRCRGVPHYDQRSGEPLGLFPIEKPAGHINVGGFGTIQCGLMKLGEITAVAKYKGLQSIVGIKPTKRKADTIKATDSRAKKIKLVTGVSLHDSSKNTPALSSTSLVTEPQADTDIPVFFRKFASKYPFGNVHMALRVGPLIIENGVAQ